MARTVNPVPKIRSVLIEDITIPAGTAPAILQLATVPVSVPTMVQLSARVGAVDVAVPQDASHTVLEQAYRVTSGQLGALAANLDDKKVTAPAPVNTFPADVLFLVVAGLAANGRAALNLHANNPAGGDRRGRVVVTYWYTIAPF